MKKNQFNFSTYLDCMTKVSDVDCILIVPSDMLTDAKKIL